MHYGVLTEKAPGFATNFLHGFAVHGPPSQYLQRKLSKVDARLARGNASGEKLTQYAALAAVLGSCVLD